VDDHGLVGAVRELGEQPRVARRAIAGLRGARDQLVHALRELLQLRLVGLQVDAAGRRPLSAEHAADLPRHFRDAREFAPLHQVQDQQQRRHDGEQQAQQPEEGHLQH
jgi:hypothetical protein